MRIGIVVGRFNREVGEALLAACTAALTKHGVRAPDIRVVTVPGALEVPLALQKMANTGRFDALVALGAVIRGETYHFEVVANESASGITAVALDTGVPVANGILTTNDEEQALARVAQKGEDCALAAIEMANLLKMSRIQYRLDIRLKNQFQTARARSSRCRASTSGSLPAPIRRLLRGSWARRRDSTRSTPRISGRCWRAPSRRRRSWRRRSRRTSTASSSA